MSALEQLGAFHFLGLYTTNSWRRARPVPAPPSAVSVRPVTRIEGDYRTNKSMVSPVVATWSVLKQGGLRKSIRSHDGEAGPRSSMRAAPGDPQKARSIRCCFVYQGVRRAVEPFVSSRGPRRKPRRDEAVTALRRAQVVSARAW